jgi:hypothetical protein
MGFKTRIGDWIHQKTAPVVLTELEPASNQQTSVATFAPNSVITDERGRDAEVVSGTFVPTIDATGNGQMEAHKHAARLRETIESFDEDKQGKLEWLVVKFFTVLAYILPPFVAWVVGQAIGQAWAGKFDWGNAWSVFSYVISVSLEMMIPALGYAVTVTIKRAVKDRSQIWVPFVLGAVFITLAVGNSYAQIYLIEGHIHLAKDDTAGHISMYFRSFAPLIIDTISTIFLSVVTVKNLQKFLKDMQHKATGIHAVAHSEIAVEQAFDDAAIERERKRMDNDLLRGLNQRRNEDTLGGDSGRKGRYGGGW